MQRVGGTTSLMCLLPGGLEMAVTQTSSGWFQKTCIHYALVFKVKHLIFEPLVTLNRIAKIMTGSLILIICTKREMLLRLF